MTLRELGCRLIGLPRRQNPDPDLDDEIASHLELAKADYLRQGMDEAEAQRLAGMKFGSVAAAKENVWEQRHAPGMGALLQDVRYAARGMRQSPGFTLTTIATLGLGIGLCSVMFSVLYGGMRPLPGVKDPDQLVMLENPVPYPWFESYRDQGRDAWSASAFMAPVPFAITVNSSSVAAPERIDGALVSPDYFSTLRVQPMLGRFFDPQREQAGASPTAVVTERFWRTHLHADPHVIGRTLRVNGRAVPIIGVGARDFVGATAAFTFPDVFIAATADPKIAPELQGDVLHRTTQPVFAVMLRLHPGITMAQAEARLDTKTRAFGNQPEKKGRQVRLMSAGTLLPLPKEAIMLFLVFYGALISVIIGLICANLGGLLLARGAARRREFAIRLAIGADRLRLVRQLLTESAILAAGGGIAGFATASAIIALLRRIRTVSDPLSDSMTAGPDLKAALFTFAISAIAAAGFGLLPALAITRVDLMHAMKANLSTGLERYRRLGLRNLFVVSQVAAAMMLVLIMGFFIVGARYGSKTEPGFDPGPVSYFSVDPVRDGLSGPQALDVLRSLPQRLGQLSGVDSVSLADRPPLDNTYPDTPVSVPTGNARALTVHNVVIQRAGPGFFTTLGAPVLRGTDFRDPRLLAEDASQKVLPVAINQTAATELFGNRDPLGGEIRQDNRRFQVAAVVRYAPRAMLMGRPIPIMFVPLTAKDLERDAAGATIVVIHAHTPIGIAELRRQLAAIDPRLTLFNPKTMRESLAQWDRIGSRVMTYYTPIGLFGLILACLGLAGVTAQTVQRRSKEIGIRMALGARRSQVLRLVMEEGAIMVVIGAAVGYGAASALLRVLAAVAAPVADEILPVASNAAVTLCVPWFLIALAAIACYVPARRSASIDPIVTLREE